MAIEYKATDLPGKTLYDKEFNVQIRSVTPIEQKYILSLAQKDQKTQKEYIDFLRKLIVIDNPEVKIEDLYWYDIKYLLYRIRYMTYQRYPIKLEFKCAECGAKIIQDLNIGKLDITEPENIQRTITLENLGELPIRNKLLKDDDIMNDFAKKLNIAEDDIQMRLLILDLCLISSEERPLEKLWELAEAGEITAADIVMIEKWFENNEWGIKEEVNTVCPNCKKEASKGYLLSIEDFFSVV